MLDGTPHLKINNRLIGRDEPTYFIADVAANHDGDIERAKALIHLAAEAGADAAKFQHFAAETIVSDHGFRALGDQQSHQAQWRKSVFEVYKDASLNPDWTPELKATCDEAGIAFFTSPYSPDLVDAVDPYIPAYKIGSGDITWHGIIRHIASKQKPYILATGASTATEVQRAVDAALEINPQLGLMQCNTNYTGSLENFQHIQLNVLQPYRAMYPDLVLGLSDHTPGHATVLGAVALGARMIEKHFTDDQSREGPDHGFSMSPVQWRDMVDRTRELERALGKGCKTIEPNEVETAVLQRRALRCTRDLPAGHILTPGDLFPLRPCPKGACEPWEEEAVIGRSLRKGLTKGEHLTWTHLD